MIDLIPLPYRIAIIAAVTAPISYLQKVVFEAYISAKDSVNDNTRGVT